MSSGPDASPASPLPPAKTIAAWRVLLRALGILVALFTICFWAAKGYNKGWTKDEVPVKQVDPITEVEYVTYEKRYVPGINVLGGGIFAGLVIFAATFVPARSRKAL